MRRSSFALALAAGLVLVIDALACRPTTSAHPDSQVWGRRSKGKQVLMNRAKAPKGDASPVLDILEAELEVNLAKLRSKDLDAPVYFLAYDLVAIEQFWVESQDGHVVRRDHDADRSIDIDVRVGDNQLDNSHSQDGNYGPGNGLGSGLPVSMEDVHLSLAQSLWLDTEEQYRDAVAALSGAESATQLRSEKNAPKHPDFSREKTAVHIEPEASMDLEALDRAWTPVVRALSRILGDHPEVLASNVALLAEVQNRHLVSSEGARVQSSRSRIRIVFSATAQAEDGMHVERAENFEVHTVAQLPDEDLLRATAKRLREELIAVRRAPVAEPFSGPAVLEGRAAGVFFHEIFGHRLEGHRQKDDLEGQTFTKMLGKRVLPAFIDVVDDPTVTTLGGVPLSGHYFVDDEAVKSRRTVLVERGKLKGFLLGRSPVLPFKRSNGHGRRERGYQVVARQGNLIVTSRKALSRKRLRNELKDEIKRQNKPYGLWFADIEGGYTMTDRIGPQAFKVLPLLVYRVYPGNRPDELVRGVDVVGTPLQAFETIIATGADPGIFNGLCGAESGWVPVSAVSPSLLLRSIEIERAVHDRDRPPLLPPPRAVTKRVR